MPCGDSPCNQTEVSQVLGSVVYSGPWNPQFGADRTKPPHQNFTVTVPDTYPAGQQVSLGVAHLEYVGVSMLFLLREAELTARCGVQADAAPFYEFVNTTLLLQ